VTDFEILMAYSEKYDRKDCLTFSHTASPEESTEVSKMLILLLGKVSQLRAGSPT